MKCPKCGGNSEVFDSRDTLDGLAVRRRRKCDQGHRWTTYEIEMDMPQYKDGRTKGKKGTMERLGAIAGRRIVGDAYDEIV